MKYLQKEKDILDQVQHHIQVAVRNRQRFAQFVSSKSYNSLIISHFSKQGFVVKIDNQNKAIITIPNRLFSKEKKTSNSKIGKNLVCGSIVSIIGAGSYLFAIPHLHSPIAEIGVLIFILISCILTITSLCK